LFTYQFLSPWSTPKSWHGQTAPPSRSIFLNTQDAISAAIAYASQKPDGQWGLSAAEGPSDAYFAYAAPPLAVATGGTASLLEGEAGTGWTNSYPRSNASGQKTAWLTNVGQTLTLPFDVPTEAVCNLDVRYSNDGPSDTIQLFLDGKLIGPQLTTRTLDRLVDRPVTDGMRSSGRSDRIRNS